MIVTDDEYPGLRGTGRTTREAERDFAKAMATTWHQRRIDAVQVTVDQLFHAVTHDRIMADSSGDGMGVPRRDDLIELQRMIDDYIGELRNDGRIPPLDTQS